MYEGYKPTSNDWPEDFEHENGNYTNKCCHCGVEFIGHKRRVVCKICAKDSVNALDEKFDFRKKFTNNAKEFDTLMVLMLAENKQLTKIAMLADDLMKISSSECDAKEKIISDLITELKIYKG